MNRRAHLHTVEASEEVVEDDHVAVDGEEREKARDRHQEEDTTCGLQAGAAVIESTNRSQ